MLAGVRLLAQDEEIIELQEFVVVGSRSQFRAVADSPVPVSIIETDVFENLADTDMDSMLGTIIPSYTVNQQPINDAATLVRPANLRRSALGLHPGLNQW